MSEQRADAIAMQGCVERNRPSAGNGERVSTVTGAEPGAREAVSEACPGATEPASIASVEQEIHG